MSGRLFVAADLDERGSDFAARAIDALRAAGFDARFIPRDKWHATVAFLGPVDSGSYEAVASALRAAAARCLPFDVTLDAVGAFPNAKRPRVVWVGSSAPQPGFAACAGVVREALGVLGFTFADDAVPHVTICRLKPGRDALPAVDLVNLVRFRIDSLTLYESTAAGRTTRYAVLERLPLGHTKC